MIVWDENESRWTDYRADRFRVIYYLTLALAGVFFLTGVALAALLAVMIP